MNRTTQSILTAVAAAGVIVGVRATMQPADAEPVATARHIESIDSPTGPGAAESNLAIGPDGKVYLSWLEPAPDSAMAMRFASYDGARWSPAQTIRQSRDLMVNWADFPSMAVGPNGQLAAHWLQRHGRTAYAYDVRIAQSSDGGRTWKEPIAPHADRSSTEKGFVTLWPEGNSFGAVWLDGRKADKAGPDPKQEMMLFTATLAPGAPVKETLLDGRTCDCCQTTAAMTADGPIIAYRDRSENEIRDIYVTRRVNGAWTEPKAVHADGWKIDACPVNGPFAAAAGRRVALAWFTAANDVPRVKVAFSSDGGATFSAPIVVDEGSPAGRVGAVLLPDGSALVSWIERTAGDVAAVKVRRVREKEGASAPMTVASSTAARASGFPRMALAGNHVYFAWTVPGRPSMVKVARAEVGEFR